MTKTSLKNRSITLSSLLNTLERLWDYLNERNQAWLRIKEKPKEWDYWDEAEAEDKSQRDRNKWIKCRNEACVILAELLQNLIEAVEKNPYPGNRMRVIDVAAGLFPDVIVEVPGRVRRRDDRDNLIYEDKGVEVEPGRMLKGLALWRWFFGAVPGDGLGMEMRLWGIAIDCETKVYFPAETEDVDVLEVEELLLRIVGEEEELLVVNACDVLHWEPRSKTYKAVKKALEERGWRWASKRVEGKKVKVIVPP